MTLPLSPSPREPLLAQWNRLKPTLFTEDTDGIVTLMPPYSWETVARMAVDVLAALASSPTSEGWQPIATAPKDGRVLTFGDVGADDPAFEVAELGADGRWWVADFDYTVSPTHWRPLPEPPTQEQP